MLGKIIVPEPIPAKKIQGYGMTETIDDLLTWNFVSDQMAQAKYYWISSIYFDSRPHVVPVWGIWHENRFHFDGSAQTAWSKNLIRNPNICVHLPDGEKVVIIEGTAHTIQDDEIDNAMWKTLDTAYQSKYQVDGGSPYWYVQPGKVLAWNGETLITMTRWVFD